MTTTQTAGEKPLVFDDPVLEAALRTLFDKPAGDVFASDLAPMYKAAVTLQYQPESDMFICMASGGGIDAQANVPGKVTSFNVLTALPLTDITIGYGVPASNTSATYQFDMNNFAKSGKLKRFYFYGNHESSLEKKHVQSFLLQNFASLAKCTSLTNLKLYDCQGVDLGMAANWKQLTEASINNCGINSIEALRNSTKLETLSLSYSPLSDLSPIAGNPCLRWVELNDMAAVDTGTLLSLPNLQTLEAHNCPSITKEAYQQLYAKGVKVTLWNKDGLTYIP